MYRGIIATIFFSIIAANSRSQPILPLNDDYNYLIEKSVPISLKFHSAIKPYNLSELKLDSALDKKLINFIFFRNQKNVSAIPVCESTYSGSVKNDYAFAFAAGTSIKARYGKNWYLQLNFTENLNRFPNYVSEKIDSNKVVPHFGRYNAKAGTFYNNALFTGMLHFSPRSYLSLSAGIDRNFIGDGYRSMFLSDNSAPYPFARLNVSAWRIKYIFLYTFFKDINSYSGYSDFYGKHAVIHYFSYNVNDRLNLGFFEAIVWANRDSDTYRGIEPNYLDPMIFFRPVEFSQNSPDNANLGGSMKIRLWKHTYFYSQVFLDDFMLKYFFSNKGWWGNKYGLQAGLKCFNFLNLDNLYFQTEFNYTRPYTYSHATSLKNYGNNYQPLAHPLGANFEELVFILRYTKNKWLFTFKSVSALYGADTSVISFGGNIYKPYTKPPFRLNDFGNYTAQGLRTRTFFGNIKISYFIIPRWNMCAVAGCNFIYRKNSLASTLDNYIYFGISTLLYNNNNDY
jgi:hypothetical protein